MSSKAKEEVRKLIGEATSHHNDGWVMAGAYMAYSDERIKTIKGVSNGVEDLETLKDIVITDYVYKDHYAPHDIEVTDFSNGKTRREVAYQLGIRFKVVPKIPLEDGIHATTMILPRCWIDVDHCKNLIDALRHYHRKYIDKNRMFRSKPVHDWSSHACDAMRYLSVGLQEINTRQSAPQSVADNEYRIL